MISEDKDKVDLVEVYITKALNKMTLGHVRLSKHITKKQMSELTGLSLSTISNIESRSGNPTIDSLEKYLNVLGWEFSFVPKDKKE